MSRKRVFLLLGIILLLAGLGYAGARVLLEIGDKTLGVRRGSVSKMQSRDAGFYVGTYVPAKRLVALNTPSALHIPDAWVEHAWKRELSLFLRETKQVTDGYYVYIPIPADESPDGRKPIWKFGFTLELEQREGSHLSYHRTGFDSGLGFVVFVDTLPEILNLAVRQKQPSANDTNDAVITDTIEFKRAF
ncbi:MAG: hypothetical protein WCE51_13970 [Chthoniobacterales bacterium]